MRPVTRHLRQPTDLVDLLRFYARAGVDEALDEAPVDRFAAAARTGGARADGSRAGSRKRASPAGGCRA